MSKIPQHLSRLPFIAANYHFPGHPPADIWLTMCSLAPLLVISISKWMNHLTSQPPSS